MSPRDQLSILCPKEIKAKLKGYAALTNTPLGVFIRRILIEKIQKIEKGEDAYIKIERKK